MAEVDGQTCATCMTLNPPAAPACVRCNTPLPPPAADPPSAGPAAGPAGAAAAGGPTAGTTGGAATPAPDPTTGSKRIGPGLAGPSRADPGSSRAAAAPEQPPGYGLDAPAPPPGPPGPDPAELLRARRRVAVAGLVLVALLLAGGAAALWLTRPRYVDAAAVGRSIGAELTARLGDRVTVDCPGTPRRRAGETFRCTATDQRGGRQPVTVTLIDDAGRYRWRLGP